jgi:ABC-type branched-subunit amino acid transport system ATPase component/ABC-type branched-subunit amino acid transport system permease subunit
VTATVVLRRGITALVLIAAAALAPFVVGTDIAHVGQLSYIAALVMVACGLNIVYGFAGQWFLGPGALFGLGGYFAGVLAGHHPSLQPLPVMCLVGAGIAVVAGAIIAMPALRVSGFYLGLVTLFLALVAPLAVSRIRFFGRPLGISLIFVHSFRQRPSGLALYECGVAIVAVLAGGSWLILHSRLGRRFSTVGAGDQLAEALGVSPYGTKLLAFLLAAIPCGVGGAFYVYSQQVVSPTTITPRLSLYLFGAVVIGGSRSVVGPLVSTAIVMAAPEFLSKFTQYEGLVFGILLIWLASSFPNGAPSLAGLGRRWSQRRRTTVTATVTTSAAAPAASARATGEHATVTHAPVSTPAPLVVSGTSRRFGGVQALDDVSLTVDPGSVHALIGPNGSGKTTMLNLICGYYHPDRGHIRLGDDRLDGRRPAAIARLGVGRTFQTPLLAVDETVLANVVAAADRNARGTVAGSTLRAPGARRGDRDAYVRAEQALAAVGLAGVTSEQTSALPHGAHRLLEIARALALQPRLLLLDEPAAGLTVAETAVLGRTIADIAATGVAVLLVEHNLPVVFDVADVVTVLDQGAVIATGSPAEVSTNAEVGRVYIGRRAVSAK